VGGGMKNALFKIAAKQGLECLMVLNALCFI